MVSESFTGWWVAVITLISGSSTVTVARAGDVWVAPGKYNYPLDASRVKRFLLTLADMKIGQTVAGSESLLASLNLLSPSGKDTEEAGIQVMLRDKDKKVLAELIVGKEHQRAAKEQGPYGGYPDGRYVAAGSTACLVKDPLTDLPKDVAEWMDKQLINVSSSDITNISVVAGTTTLAFVKAKSGNDFQLSDLGKDETMDTGKASGVANMLSWLDFSDVADPSKSDAEFGFDKAVSYIARTKEGKVYTLTLGAGPKDSKDRYARLTADYQPPEVVTTNTVAGATNAVMGVSAAEKEKQKKIAREIRELNEKLKSWTFVLRSYKVENISTNRTDYIKKEEPKAVKGTPEAVKPTEQTEKKKPEKPAVGEASPKLKISSAETNTVKAVTETQQAKKTVKSSAENTGK